MTVRSGPHRKTTLEFVVVLLSRPKHSLKQKHKIKNKIQS